MTSVGRDAKRGEGLGHPRERHARQTRILVHAADQLLNILEIQLVPNPSNEGDVENGAMINLRITVFESGTDTPKQQVDAPRATVEFEATGRYANPMGTLHGGVLCDVADAAMGAAYGSTLSDGESFATLELKINFLRPVWNAKLRAEATIVHCGKVVGLVECDIIDEQERLVARASSTCMTLRGELAAGR